MKTKMKITNTKNVQVQFLPAQKTNIKHVIRNKSKCVQTRMSWQMMSKYLNKNNKVA
jgi:hypothetical protein